MKHFRLLTLAVCVLLMGSTAFAQEDITDQYLVNADLSSIGGGWTNTGYTDWKNDGAVPVVEFWNWSTAFSFTQTINLPAGDYRLAVNSFYRHSWGGNGTNNDMAWIFAGEKKQNVAALNSMNDLAGYTGSNDLYRAATAFSQGQFSNAFDFSIEADNTEITIGFTGTTPDGGWCILGPVKLYKYSLENYLVDYRAKVAEAQALYDQPMNADVLSALQAAVVNESTFSLSSQVTEAIANLTQKIAAAETSIQNYKDALNVINAASTLTDAGKAYYAASDIIQEIQGAYDARTLVSLTAEQRAAATEALVAAVLKQTEVGADFTPAAPTDWVGQTGTYGGTRAERYNATDRMPYEYDGDVMTQTIEGLSPGAYKVILEATASFTSGRGFTCKTGDNLAAVFANNTNVNLPVIDRTGVGDSDYGPYEVIGKVGADGVLKYGITKIDPLGGNWFVVKLISITKVEYIPVESIAAEDVELEIGNTATIGATITPGNATFPTITYTSGDENIATVDAEGNITGVALGQTTITVTADEVSKTINVSVVAPAILPESITLEPATVNLKFGEATTSQIIATVVPSEANQEVTFTSSDESVATVDAQGNVTATGIGSATITVTSVIKEDVTAIATVSVTGADAPISWTSLSEVQDGRNYWLYNAATGKYFGGANDWGTRASIIEHGIPFKFTKAGEGIYTLDSYTNNGGNSHFVNGEWIDQGIANHTFVANSNNTVSFGITDAATGTTTYLQATGTDTYVNLNGSDTNNPFAQWYILSMDDRIQNLENGSDTDATFFIKDFNFSRNSMMYDDWKWTFADPNNQNHNNAGDNTNLCVESYHAAFNQTQVIGLPNGTYQLTAQGFYRNDGGTTPPVFFANDEELTFPERTGTENSMANASISFSAGLYKSDPIVVTVNDHILKIGAKCDNTGFWCIWDNFELELVSLSSEQNVTVGITDVGYATMYYGTINLKSDNDVTPTPYAVTVNDDGKTVTLQELPMKDEEGNYYIPAGTAVVLEGAPSNYNFKPFYESIEEFDPIMKPKNVAVENELLGTDEDTEITEEEGRKYYMLSTNSSGLVGFYLFNKNEDGKIVNTAHKAYLKVDANQSIAGYYLLFNEADGISNATITTENNNEVYTLSGMRVNGKLNKGVYIMNGKKVVIK